MSLLHQQVYRLYFEQEKTQREIARKLDISRAKIITMFKEYGWKSRPARPRREEANPDEVYRLYFEKGLSQREVAEKLSLSSMSPVQRIFKENGWETRGRWGNGATYDRRCFSTEEERKIAIKERADQRQLSLRKLRQKIFGTECKICGVNNQEKLLAIHRKDFKKHKQNMLWLKNNLRAINPKEWVFLCIACHRGVHWLKDYYSADWSDIEQCITRNREMIPEVPESFVLSNKDKITQEFEESRGNITELRKLIFGKTCSLCEGSENRRIVIHRKDGKLHNHKILWSESNLKLLDSDDWIALCQKCHRYVHWAMKNLNLKWEDFEYSIL